MSFEQVTGAAIGAVVVLGYVLVVQAMTAAIVLLVQLIVVQVRALRSLVGPVWRALIVDGLVLY
jgi:hypothetical protein